MANISKIKLNGTTYDVEDTKARTDVGDVTTLKTTDKSNLVKAVNECFQSASDGKSAIANAITGAGVSTSASATFATMATNIGTVATNKYNAGVTATKVGTATATQVLAGKTFTNASSVGITGTMPDKSGTAEYQTTPILNNTNKQLEMVIPEAGYYGTSNKLKASYSTIANLIGLTSTKLVRGNSILGVSGAADTGRKYVSGEDYELGTHPNAASIYWRAIRESVESARNTSGQTIVIDPGFEASILLVTYTYLSSGGVFYWYTAVLVYGCYSFQFSCVNDEESGDDYGYTSYFKGYMSPRYGNKFYVPSSHLSSEINSLSWEAWE